MIQMAVISNEPTPYRLHVLQRMYAKELEEVQIHNIFYAHDLESQHAMAIADQRAPESDFFPSIPSVEGKTDFVAERATLPRNAAAILFSMEFRW